MGVSFGGESIFGKVCKTSIFEHFTVEPELVQLIWNFVEDFLVCICSQDILFEKNRWWFGEAIKYTKVYQTGVVYHSGVDDCIWYIHYIMLIVYLRIYSMTKHGHVSWWFGCMPHWNQTLAGHVSWHLCKTQANIWHCQHWVFSLYKTACQQGNEPWHQAGSNSGGGYWIAMLLPMGGRLPKLDEALRENLEQKVRLSAIGRILPGSSQSLRESHPVQHWSICTIGSQHYYTTTHQLTFLMFSHYFQLSCKMSWS